MPKALELGSDFRKKRYLFFMRVGLGQVKLKLKVTVAPRSPAR